MLRLHELAQHVVKRHVLRQLACRFLESARRCVSTRFPVFFVRALGHLLYRCTMKNDTAEHDPRFDPYNLAVGRIAMIMAQIEYDINDAIWELQNLDTAVGACVTAHITSPGQRMRALIALIHHRGASPTLMRRLNKFCEKIERLARQRNQYIHDHVQMTIKDGTLWRVHVSADRELDFDFKPADLTGMKTLFDTMGAASREFHALRARALAELPPWPRKEYEQSHRGVLRRRAPGSES